VRADTVLDESTLRRVNDATNGKLTEKEIEKLNQDISKQTGIESRSSYDTRPYLDVQELYREINSLSQSMSKEISSNIKSPVSSEITSPQSLQSEMKSMMKSIQSDMTSQMSPPISPPSYPPYPPMSPPSGPLSSGSPLRGSPKSPPTSPPVNPPMLPPISPPKIVGGNLKYPKYSPKKTSLGQGYDVFIKVVKTQNFAKINTTPVTHNRAKDIEAYYLDNTLARTAKVKKSNNAAQVDYQFMHVPEGYYQQRKYTLREYRVKKGTPFAFGEQEIKKSKYLQDTAEERRQLQAFRKQAEAIAKGKRIK
jgi:hypothetical protein